jgi:flagellar protein FliL
MSSQAGQPAEAAPSKGGKKLPILVASVLALGAGGFVAYRKLAAVEGAGVEKKGEEKAVVVDPGVLEVEPFVLNLADPAGDRYFRLNLRLVLDQRAIAERAGTGLSQVKMRDRLLGLLSKKRASAVTSLEGKELLRNEIWGAAEALLAEPPFYEPETDPAPARVLDVLFMEFLVQ